MPATAQRVPMRGIEAELWPGRANLVEVDGIHATLSDQASDDLVHLLLPQLCRGAHRRELGAAAILLNIGRRAIRLLARGGTPHREVIIRRIP